MNTKRNTFAAVLLMLMAISGAFPVMAQSTPDRLTTVIEIQFPEGAEPLVEVEPGERTVKLTLPRGSRFPLDFVETSNGLLRTGSVNPAGDGRIQLQLELAQGAVERIDYSSDGIVVHIGRRLVALDLNARATDNYLLGPDDTIKLTVHNQDQLSAELTVTREGTIFPPLVGETRVEGMTPRDVAILLTEKLGRSFLVDPQVDVEVKDFRSQWVMVTGEVHRLGRITLRGGTRLKEVLSEAGGFNEFAGERITISRRIPNSSEYEVQRIGRAEFELGEIDPTLHHGDIVDVARSEFCYIQGEVGSPGRIAIERGLTLMRAIALVGGLTEWANRKEVRVLFPDDEGGARVEVFNLKRIQHGQDKDLALHGGETIIIERRYF